MTHPGAVRPRQRSALLLVAAGALVSAGCPHIPVINPPKGKPPTPPGRTPPRPPVQPPPVSTSTEVLQSQGRNDENARQIICFALASFYDDETRSFVLPSKEAFAEQVVQELASATRSPYSLRLKANELHEHLEQGDALAVSMDVGCG